jgi:hypothetical protein
MTALTTLYAAHKYMCPGLAKQVKFAFNVKIDSFSFELAKQVKFAFNVKIDSFSFELAKQVMIQFKFVLTVKALFSFELAKQVMIRVKFVFYERNLVFI